MKNTKFVQKLFAVVLAISMVLSATLTYAAEVEIKVLVDNVKVDFDVPPQIINERVMVPMRAIFDHFGANVFWDGDTQTITATYDGIILKTVLGESSMKIDGVDKPVDVPSQAIDGRVLVPVRFISEAFECKVEWHDGAKTVFITTKSDAQDILEGLDIQGLYKPPVVTDVVLAQPNCYPGIPVPSYTIVTGEGIKRHETLETGEIVYVHEMNNTGAITTYYDKLLAEGWVIYNMGTNATENNGEVIFIRDGDKITIGVDFGEKEVKITYKKK